MHIWPIKIWKQKLVSDKNLDAHLANQVLEAKNWFLIRILMHIWPIRIWKQKLVSDKNPDAHLANQDLEAKIDF